jgi:hypothetical protein
MPDRSTGQEGELMVSVTYKNVLKPDKNKADYEAWQKKVWAVHKRWGATSFKIWPEQGKHNRILFCRYLVKDLNRWNDSAMSPEAEPLVRSLSEVVDIHQISMAIEPIHS